MGKELSINVFENCVLEYLRQQYLFQVINTGKVSSLIKEVSLHFFLLSNGRRKKFVYISVHQSLKTELSLCIEKISDLFRKDGTLPDIIEVYSPYVQKRQVIKEIKELYAPTGIEISIFEYNTLIDNSSIAPLLESKEITEFSEIKTIDKALYDLILHSASSYDIKKDVLTAYIEQTLHDNQETRDDLIEKVSFTTECTKDVVGKIVDKLANKKKIHLNENKKYELSKEEHIKIDDIISTLQKEEREMKVELLEVFNEYNIPQEHRTQLVEKLIEIYKRPIDISSPKGIKKMDDNKHDTAIHIFKQEIASLISVKNTENFCNSILEVCSRNRFLDRVGASATYMEYYQKPEFQSFVNAHNKHIFLDTSPIEYLFCKQTGYVLKDKEDWTDKYYDFTIKLYDTQRQNKGHMHFFTTEGYIDEACGELQKALSCALFDEYEGGVFKIGKNTRNVFYNYYLFLKEKGHIDSSVNFANFVHHLGLPNQVMQENFLALSRKKIRKELENQMGISVVPIDKFDESMWIASTGIYDNILNKRSAHKTKTAETIDVQLVLHLLTSQDKQNTKDVYYFSTWDKTISPLRDELQDKYPNKFQFFAVYNPGALLNVLSLEKVKISPKWMNEITFAYADQAEGVSQKMRNFVDHVLLPLMNTNPDSIQFFNTLFEIQKQAFGDYVMDKDSSRENDLTAPIEQILDDMRRMVQGINSVQANFGEYLRIKENRDYVTDLYQKCIKSLSKNEYSVEMLNPLKEHYQQFWQHMNDEFSEQLTIE